jgi:hypothetical protein
MDFLADRCAKIDTVGGNVLIRGNIPLIGEDQHFAYDEIAKKSKTDLSKYHLIDFCIIDNVGERAFWSKEIAAFGVDPNTFPIDYWPPYFHQDYDPKKLLGTQVTTQGKTYPGSMVWWPFEGLPVDENPQVFLHAPGWNYAGFIDYVIELLKTRTNTAIYVHCMLGADRTGAFHIGYLMKSRGLDVFDATTQAVPTTSAGPPNADYARLVAAYKP